MNTDITALKAITTALQQNVSIISYKATSTGYTLTMSNGTTINLSNGKDGTNGTNGTNGKDGVNALAIGVKQNTDGFYYWTLDGNFIIQNGNKLPVTGKDGQNGSNGSNGSNGTNGITPLLQVNTTANQWMISYDNGNSWQIVRDSSGNPVPATGPSGPTGPIGPTGPQGPSGIPGFSIEEGDGIITVTYLGSSYTLVKAQWQISSGNWHTLFVSPEGNLYGTGQNSYGQLGLGDNNNRNTPVFIMNNVQAVAANGLHSLILKKDGTLWATGYNYDGQLGTGNNTTLNTPARITNNVKAIAAGVNSS